MAAADRHWIANVAICDHPPLCWARSKRVCRVSGMRVMILAAGRGERMRPLTDRTPKPLLQAGGRSLLEHHFAAVRAAGLRQVVVNSSHLGEQVRDFVGNGGRWGLQIVHSSEAPPALETGGGIAKALPLLGRNPFLVLNGDIWSDYDLGRLPRLDGGLAHLILVNNPPHHAVGDFGLREHSVTTEGNVKLTYSGIAILHPDLFNGCPRGAFPLAPLLRNAIRAGLVTGEHFKGQWVDVGTPQRLQDLDNILRDRRTTKTPDDRERSRDGSAN